MGFDSHDYCYVILFSLVLSKIRAQSTSAKSNSTTEELLSKLESILSNSKQPENTDKPPKPSGGPVQVVTDIYITDLSDVNEENMDFRIDMFIFHKWTVPAQICSLYDGRLKKIGLEPNSTDSQIIPATHFNLFWLPDTYVMSAKITDTPSKDSISKTLRVKHEKRECIMEYILRRMSVISCQLEFSKYPLDVQRCPVSIRSFSYDEDTLMYRWRTDNPIPESNPDITLLEFALSMMKSYDTTTMFNSTFTVLSVHIRFERQLAHMIMQMYCPSILIVSLAWFSFWMGLDAIPGRVTVCVTSLLSLVTMFAGSKDRLPPVSYANRSDIWMFTCMLFVFSSMMEFTFVKWVDTKQKEDRERKPSTVQTSTPRSPSRRIIRSISRKMSHRIIGVRDTNHMKVHAWEIGAMGPQYRAPSQSVAVAGAAPINGARRKAVNRATPKQEDWVKKTDHLACIIFPILFIIFNLFYWPVLFSRV